MMKWHFFFFFFSADFKENADPSAEKQASSGAQCDATPSIRYCIY